MMVLKVDKKRVREKKAMTTDLITPGREDGGAVHLQRSSGRRRTPHNRPMTSNELPQPSRLIALDDSYDMRTHNTHKIEDHTAADLLR
jgi:hypothetical protein